MIKIQNTETKPLPWQPQKAEKKQRECEQRCPETREGEQHAHHPSLTEKGLSALGRKQTDSWSPGQCCVGSGETLLGLSCLASPGSWSRPASCGHPGWARDPAAGMGMRASSPASQALPHDGLRIRKLCRPLAWRLLSEPFTVHAFQRTDFRIQSTMTLTAAPTLNNVLTVQVDQTNWLNTRIFTNQYRQIFIFCKYLLWVFYFPLNIEICILTKANF